MRVYDFFRLSVAGVQPIVEFREGVASFMGYLEPGMRGRIVEVKQSGANKPYFDFKIDLREFDDHNRAFEVADCFDKNGEQVVTPREVGLYPPNGIEMLCLLDDDKVLDAYPLDMVFVLVDEARASLYSEWLDLRPSVSYLAWLEEQLLTSRTKLNKLC